MKTTLNIEESARLIELGVDANKASEIEYRPKKSGYGRNKYLVYSLADLLSILPKEINYNELTYGLNMWVENAIWNVEYCTEKEYYDLLIDSNIDAPELIDALNQLLIWCLKQGYLKIEKK